MHKSNTIVIVTVLLLAALAPAGCGGSGGGEETAPNGETTTVSAPESSLTAATTASESPDITAAGEAPAGAEDWTTVATLKSDAEPWQGMEDLLVSDPFTVKGKARLVLNMPDAGELDGVILAIISADQLADPITIIDAIRDGTAFTLIPAYPVKELDDLDGTYVLLNSVPTETPWTVELQTP